GGTVGDIEGLPFLEAIRQMRLEEGFENTLYVHVALVPILDVTNEMKTKPLQHSVNELRRIGIQPDIIIARCSKMIAKDVLEKIALFGTIQKEAVFSSYNVSTVYKVPLILDEQGMGDYICRRLLLPYHQAKWDNWRRFVESVENPKYIVKIALVGKYAGLTDSYVSMNEAFKHSGAACKTQVIIDYIEAEMLEKNPEKIIELKKYDGIFVPYGFGPRGTEGKIRAIRFARENDVPFLGICYGFQLAAVEFARNVCALDEANSTEICENTMHPVVCLMHEQYNVKYKGATMRLGAHKMLIKEATLAHKLYGASEIYERHRHRWEINPKYWDVLEKHGIVFSGRSPDGKRIEILELPDKYFFFASQFHGEFKSRPEKPEPEYYGFVKACLDRKLGKPKPEF
ncbi:MAG: CTP synthase (glutamine hydrolyzing), partial [Candidatus Bathyarchaeia archaeon]